MADLLPRVPRVEALLGRRLSDVDAVTLNQMVAGHVREDTEIDFKVEVYDDGEKGHSDAATDVEWHALDADQAQEPAPRTSSPRRTCRTCRTSP